MANTPKIPSSGKGFGSKKSPKAAKIGAAAAKRIPKVRTGLVGATLKGVKTATKAATRSVGGAKKGGRSLAGAAKGGAGNQLRNATKSGTRKVASLAGKGAKAVAKNVSRKAMRMARKAAVKGFLRIAQACAASGVCLVCVAVLMGALVMFFGLFVIVASLSGNSSISTGGSVDGVEINVAGNFDALAPTPVDANQLLSLEAATDLLSLLEWAPDRSITAHDVDVIVRLLGGGVVRVVPSDGSNPTEYACGYLSRVVGQISASQSPTRATVSADNANQTDITGTRSEGFLVPADTCHLLAATFHIYSVAGKMFAGEPPELNNEYQTKLGTITDSRDCSLDPQCRTTIFLNGRSNDPVEVSIPEGSVAAMGLAIIAATHPTSGEAPIVPAYLRPGVGGTTTACFPTSTPEQTAVTLPHGAEMGVLFMKCPPYLAAAAATPQMSALGRMLPCLPDPVIGRDEYDEYDYAGVIRAQEATFVNSQDSLITEDGCSELDRLESSEVVNMLRSLRPAHRPQPGAVMFLMGASDGLLNALGVAYDMTLLRTEALHEPSIARDMPWMMSEDDSFPVQIPNVRKYLTYPEGNAYPEYLPSGKPGEQTYTKNLLEEGRWQKAHQLWLLAHAEDSAAFVAPPDCHWLVAIFGCGDDPVILGTLFRAMGWGPPEVSHGLFSDDFFRRTNCPKIPGRASRTENGYKHLPGVIYSLNDLTSGAHELHLLPKFLAGTNSAWVHNCVYDDVFVLLQLGRVGMFPDLTIGSAWRSNQRQTELRVSNGCASVYSAKAGCNIPTARPGRSRHQLGMAIDFRFCSTPKTQCYKWLNLLRDEAPLFPLCSRSRRSNGTQCVVVPSSDNEWLVEAWHWSVDGS